ncbi:MAG: acyl-[acyl-carrier-protein] thioesterase [Atopobiaceae bacterium]|nr:acyl-[acyl-carrier-protein] thioesterase [Atopobiaceae bacterium]
MYSFESNVRYSECGPSSTISLLALVNYLQDCSTFHTESIGHGVEWGKDHGFAWFIAAWQIQIGRLPRFTERIRVSTWSYAKRPTLANRNFLVESADGEVLVKADSLWFPFDIHRHRPMRIPDTERVVLDDAMQVDLPPTQRKLKLQGEGQPQAPITVLEHNLDINGHVNNAQYVAMADYVVRAADKDLDVARLLVQYKNAAQLGDVIVPHLYVEDTGYAVDLTNVDGESFAIVRMERR